MVRVSVLVPIYNVEKFLPECLESLVGQTLQEMEIICINDGSTDGSLRIVEDFQKKDKRIKIIDKKNSGYGDSMNKGLAVAKGEYVGIVESDDFADSEMFEKLYEVAKKFDCDVVKSNYYEYFGREKRDEGKSELFSRGMLGRVVNPREEKAIFYQPPCIWAAIYRRKFLVENGIEFLPSAGASYQDTGFNLKVWAMAKRVYFVDEAFLHYRQDNAGSSVKDAGKVDCVKREFDEVEKFIERKKLGEKLGLVVFLCRAKAYVWNLKRLKFRAAMRFAKMVKGDYRAAMRRGILSEMRGNEMRAQKVIMFAMRHPEIYVLGRPLHDLRNMIRGKLK